MVSSYALGAETFRNTWDEIPLCPIQLNRATFLRMKTVHFPATMPSHRIDRRYTWKHTIICRTRKVYGQALIISMGILTTTTLADNDNNSLGLSSPDHPISSSIFPAFIPGNSTIFTAPGMKQRHCRPMPFPALPDLHIL